MVHTPSFPSFRYFDSFIIKNEVASFLNRSIDNFKGKVLDIGCGRMPYKEMLLKQNGVTSYTGLDIDNPIYNDNDFRPDLLWDGIKIPAEDNSFDTVMIMEVLEHCEHPAIAIAEAFRVLKPGGKLMFSVPFLIYLHDSPHDFGRYTYFKLKALFENAGFTINQIEGYGGWNRCLAHFWSMWIKRNPWPKIIRFGFYLLGLPIYLLLKSKHVTITEFDNSVMVIGHAGCVTK